MINRPAEQQIPILSPWSFDQWGINIVEPLPVAKGQVKFIVVAIDYFTKWAKEKPLATKTKKNRENFIVKNISNRLGIP